MPVSYIDCESCHAPGSALDEHDHPCANCHAVTDGHPGTPSDMHTPANVTSCTPCHDASITIEHNKSDRTTAAGAAIVCDTCHGSTDPLVTAAIAAGNSACSACHVDITHRDLHTKVNSAFCAKSGCHEPTNLIDEHITTPIKPERTMTCDTCHASTAPVVVDAISNHDRDCNTCHGQMLSGHDAMHESVMEPECLYCHAGSVSAEHIVLHNTGGLRTCSTCHDSTEPRIVTAIANQDKQCSGCHTDAGHNVPHSADFTAQNCGGCHEPDLQVEHQKASSSSRPNRCANCHSVPSSTAVDALSGAAWAKGCAQGTCHVVGTPAETHGGMAAAHALPTPSAACTAAGCHASTDLSTIHSAATTTTAGVTRSDCGVCHANGELPATNDCATCHPDRVAPHGYVPVVA